MQHALHEELKKELKAKREELLALLGRFAEKDAHVRDDFHSRFPDYGSDDEANASEVADYQDDLSIETDLNKALQDIDAALDRIEKKTFGTCSVCGKPIETERLRLMPATTLCVEHKESKQ